MCTFQPTSQKKNEPTSQKKNAGSGASNAKVSKVKKLKDEDLEDLKVWYLLVFGLYCAVLLLISLLTVKEDKKRKKRVGAKEGAKMAVVKGEKGKREKKVYEFPGQKHDPPPEV